jgi:hypothetical protein
MALDYLHDSESFGELAARLGELKGLPGLFNLHDAIYRKMMFGEFEAGRRKARAIATTLNFLLHGLPAKICGNVDKLDSFMTVIVEGCDYNEFGNTPDYTTTVLAKLCPSFIVLRTDVGESHSDSDSETWEPSTFSGIREPGPLLQFSHFSVKEYLLARQSKTYSKRAGDAHLASLCMEVFNDYEASFQSQSRHF